MRLKTANAIVSNLCVNKKKNFSWKLGDHYLFKGYSDFQNEWLSMNMWCNVMAAVQ